MTHQHTESGSHPEDRFDTWLDALVAGRPADAVSLDGTDSSLGRAMSGARQLHGLAARTTPVAAAQRRIEEKLMRSGALAAPRGTTWIPIEKETRRAPWWSPASPVIAATLVVALIVALGASFIATQRPAPSSDPAGAPGFAAATPGAPTGGSLSCGTEGYAPVVTQAVDPGELAMLGESGPVILRGEDGVTVPLPDGGETTLPAGSFPVRSVPGTYITTRDDGSRIVTSTALGKTWEFPALDFSGVAQNTAPGALSFVDAGSYVAGPVDDQGLAWRIVDLRTGDEVTTSRLLDGVFPWMVVPSIEGQHADGSNQAITFVRATQALPEIASERVAPEGEATDRALNDTVAVILPGSVDGAAVVDLGGMPAVSGSPVSGPVIFSADGTLAAWRGWEVNSDEAGFFAISIASTADLQSPVTQLRIESEPESVDPLAFLPDASRLYLRDGMTIQALSVEDGTVREGFSADAELMQILAINADAETLMVSLPGANGVEHPQTFLLDLTTGETRHLPELDGFASFMPLETAGTTGPEGYALGALDSGDDSTRRVAVIDTATGAIVAEISSPTSPENQSPLAGSAVTGPGHVVTFGDDGALHVVAIGTADAWSMPLPDLGIGITDPPIHPTVRISPNGGCLLLTVIRSDDSTEGATRGPIGSELVESWIAPLEPGAEWTKLPFATVDWWPVLASEDTAAVTLSAQAFATSAATLGTL